MLHARLEGVEKHYGSAVRTRALARTDLEIRGGELVVLLGPSGSGKTTLLNLLGGLDRPSAGRVVVGERDLARLSDAELVRFRREQVGFVFQFFNLLPNLTAAENVLMAGELVGATQADVAACLAAVGIAELADRFPGEMSGGQQQRVGIARALAKKPALLLADEPTGALDHEAGAQVFGLLRAAAHEADRAVVVVTHDEAALAFADRVVRLRDGAVVEDRRATPGASP